MTKTMTQFVCSHCDAQYSKWQGRCTECGKWNTIGEGGMEVEIALADATPLEMKTIGATEALEDFCVPTGLEQLDVVLGGGFVPGSLVLLGGDPGIGKSTLSLQVAAKLSQGKKSVLYVSAEESEAQLKLKVDRLGLECPNLYVVNSTRLEKVIATVKKEKPAFVVLDSVQTVASETLPTTAGSAPQVRNVAEQFLKVSKSLQITTILIGHVTKEGVVAGPKTLEHLVDVVLYLEGDRYGSYRLLRGVKNRFGSTGEVGIFEMGKKGLVDVKDASRVFLQENEKAEPGSAFFVTLEGRRAFLGVAQALVTQTNFGYPKRTASGFDVKRLQLLAAVLTKKAGLNLDDQDIYVKIAGGLRVNDPSVDLAVCLAIASSFYEKPLRASSMGIGEVGLTGEVRTAHQLRERLKEVEKMEFGSALVAESKDLSRVKSRLKLLQVASLSDALEQAFE